MATNRRWLEDYLLGIWFGHQTPGLLARCVLGPIGLLYRAALKFKPSAQSSRVNYSFTQSSNPPEPLVLVIGNLTVGGSGKTPLVQAVCRWAKNCGIPVGIVSRGYGRQSKQPVLLSQGFPVPPASECGDEPLMLFQLTGCPVSVNSDRKAAVQALSARFPDLRLIIADDGLQHAALRRHMEWVVFDDRAAGNGKLLPLGPLREPLSRLCSVDAIVSTAGNAQALRTGLAEQLHVHSHPTTGGRLKARRSEILVLDGLPPCIDFLPTAKGFSQQVNFLDIRQAAGQWKGLRIVAFTGIGNPNKFFGLLESVGIVVAQTIRLPDHFDYPKDFCRTLTGDVLICTSKDAVKLNVNESKLWVLELNTDLPPQLNELLSRTLGLPIH